MSAIQLMTAAKVGEAITKLVKSANALADDLHNVLVQCALHVREHGDTSLASRLVQELTEHPDIKLRGASVLNVQGVRYWLGMACPMIINRDGKWKLIDKDTETYTKYIDRLSKATADDDNEQGQPDETSGPGGRVFFVDWCAKHPFWDNGDVKAAQRQNVRVMGLGGVIGLAFAIKTQYERAIEKGLFLPSAQEDAEAFIKQVTDLAADFRKKHAVEILAEEQELPAFKAKVEAGEDDAQPEQAPATPEVGGDVTTGEGDNEVVTPKTGTEG